LILAVFMCNSGRRQERVCRAQRPAAKIDAIATSAGDRDRTQQGDRVRRMGVLMVQAAEDPEGQARLAESGSRSA
jgi:hypothetical protein